MHPTHRKLNRFFTVLALIAGAAAPVSALSYTLNFRGIVSQAVDLRTNVAIADVAGSSFSGVFDADGFAADLAMSFPNTLSPPDYAASRRTRGGCDGFLLDAVCRGSFLPGALPLISQYAFDTAAGIFSPVSYAFTSIALDGRRSAASSGEILYSYTTTSEEINSVTGQQTLRSRVWTLRLDADPVSVLGPDLTGNPLLAPGIQGVFRIEDYTAIGCIFGDCPAQYLPGSLMLQGVVDRVELASIPEPVSVVLLATGMLLLLTLVYRGRRGAFRVKSAWRKRST